VLHDPIADLVPDLKATPLHNLPLNLWISQRILPSLIFLVALRLHIVARLSRWNQAVLSGQDRYTRGDGRRCRRRDAEGRGTIHPFEENFVLYSIRMDKENRMSQLYVPVVLRNTREYVLSRHGHLDPLQVHTYETPHALIDTGALHTVLPRHVAEQLGLLLMGSTGATMAD